MWRAARCGNRTDVLARAFDDWLFDDVELEELDPGCRWIFNAANLTTGARFGFERDVVGDYVVGLAPTAGTGSTGCPGCRRIGGGTGAFAAMKIDQVKFPCAGRGVPLSARWRRVRQQRVGGARQSRYHDVFTISLNAGGVFVTGGFGKVPFVRDLARANSLLYRQSTSLRTRWMVHRFEAWEQPRRGQVLPTPSRGAVRVGFHDRRPGTHQHRRVRSVRPPGSRNTAPSQGMASNRTCRSCRPCSTSSNQVWSPRWCTEAGG